MDTHTGSARQHKLQANGLRRSTYEGQKPRLGVVDLASDKMVETGGLARLDTRRWFWGRGGGFFRHYIGELELFGQGNKPTLAAWLPLGFTRSDVALCLKELSSSDYLAMSRSFMGPFCFFPLGGGAAQEAFRIRKYGRNCSQLVRKIHAKSILYLSNVSNIISRVIIFICKVMAVSPGNQICGSKSFHQPLAYSPHASPLAVDVHWNRHEHAEKLDPTDRQEHSSRAIGFQPVNDKERENQPV